MDLPSTRELELEALVRQRDGQVAELSDEITRLRQYLVNQPAPSATDPVSLPPPLMKLLLPRIRDASQAAEPASSTVLNALTQRVKVLQEENEELYQILKVKETGKLKEEVRGLRRVVQRLEGSLRESHQVIDSLSTELEKTHEALVAASVQIPTAPAHQHTSRSPRGTYPTPATQSQPSNAGNNGTNREPPTGPRAFKKPRLSDQKQSPQPSLHHSLPPNPRSNSNSQLPQAPHRPGQQSYPNNQKLGNNSRDRPSSNSTFSKPPSRPSSKMEVDEDNNSKRNDRNNDRNREHRARDPSPNDQGRDRERDSHRHSAKDKDRSDHKERDKDRERSQKERDRGSGGGSSRDSRSKDAGPPTNPSSTSARGPPPRRNGIYQGNSRGGGAHGGGSHGRRGHSDRNTPSNGHSSVDRSLAERMGL